MEAVMQKFSRLHLACHLGAWASIFAFAAYPTGWTALAVLVLVGVTGWLELRS